MNKKLISLLGVLISLAIPNLKVFDWTKKNNPKNEITETKKSNVKPIDIEETNIQEEKIKIEQDDDYFTLKNIVKTNLLQTSASDSKGNIYYITFYSNDIHILGMTVYKDDIKTNEITRFWDNPKFKSLPRQFIVDDSGVIYLGNTHDGAVALTNNDKVFSIPKVSNSVIKMCLNNNTIWFATLDGLFKYISTNTTEKVKFPIVRPLIANIFADSRNNIYFAAKEGAYLLRNN
ncbi:MAG: hypothetical protein LBS95_02835 [Mycoplasmataceae bacterium]|nr:hypothetical protein [Mycoplasmataceae bacterium]